MRLLRLACRIQDGLTDAGFIVGVLGVTSMVVLYVTEVVTRYFLNTALDWANDAFSNILCITLFSMVPHVTREGRHIAINLVPELLPATKPAFFYFTGVAGFVVCLFATWMSLEENMRQIALEIVTEQNHPVPKIWMSAFITYGFLGAAFYFLRGLSSSPVVRPVSWVVPRVTHVESAAG
jgi:TRAP-type C4-dicarboxylate transport system permease small subunit